MLHNPAVIVALILAVLVGWFAREVWDRIVYHSQIAAEEAEGWFHEIVYLLGMCVIVAAVIGGLGWWQGWWK